MYTDYTQCLTRRKQWIHMLFPELYKGCFSLRRPIGKNCTWFLFKRKTAITFKNSIQACDLPSHQIKYRWFFIRHFYLSVKIFIMMCYFWSRPFNDNWSMIKDFLSQQGLKRYLSSFPYLYYRHEFKNKMQRVTLPEFLRSVFMS